MTNPQYPGANHNVPAAPELPSFVPASGTPTNPASTGPYNIQGSQIPQFPTLDCVPSQIQQQTNLPTRKTSLAKILLIVVIVLTLIIGVGGWAINKAFRTAFEDRLKQDIAQTCKISPDQVEVDIEGSFQILQFITGKYKRITVKAKVPVSALEGEANPERTSGGPEQQTSLVKVVLDDLDDKTKNAKHVDIFYTMETSIAEEYLKKGIKSGAGDSLKLTKLQLIDGGFHFEGNALNTSVSAVLKADVSMKLDDGNLNISIKKAIVEGAGQRIDVTREMNKNVLLGQDTDLVPFIKILRPTKFDISPKGIDVKFSADNVDLKEFTERK